MKKKPTKKDLIALINWAAHYVGSAKGIHDNDRDMDGHEKAQNHLVTVQEVLHKAAGHYPIPGKSEWTPELTKYGKLLDVTCHD